MYEEIRKAVLEQARLAEKLDLCQSGGGNFSMIDRTSMVVAITPHDTDRFKMSWRDVLLVDLDGNVLSGNPELRPTSESALHLAIYKSRKDVMACAHTHAAYVCVFAGLSMPIKPVLTEAMSYNYKCPLAKFAKPSSPELAENIVEALGKDGLAAVMEKHGLIAVSTRNIEEAVRNSLYVEKTAECYYRMIQIAGEDKVNELSISEDQIKECINYLSQANWRTGID